MRFVCVTVDCVCIYTQRTSTPKRNISVKRVCICVCESTRRHTKTTPARIKIRTQEVCLAKKRNIINRTKKTVAKKNEAYSVFFFASILLPA